MTNFGHGFFLVLVLGVGIFFPPLFLQLPFFYFGYSYYLLVQTPSLRRKVKQSRYRFSLLRLVLIVHIFFLHTFDRKWHFLLHWISPTVIVGGVILLFGAMGVTPLPVIMGVLSSQIVVYILGRLRLV